MYREYSRFPGYGKHLSGPRRNPRAVDSYIPRNTFFRLSAARAHAWAVKPAGVAKKVRPHGADGYRYKAHVLRYGIYGDMK